MQRKSKIEGIKIDNIENINSFRKAYGDRTRSYYNSAITNDNNLGFNKSIVVGLHEKNELN